MAVSKVSGQSKQVNLTTLTLHASAVEMSCDKCYVRIKRILKLHPLVLQLHKEKNNKYYSLTKCQVLSKQSSKHFTHTNSCEGVQGRPDVIARWGDRGTEPSQGGEAEMWILAGWVHALIYLTCTLHTWNVGFRFSYMSNFSPYFSNLSV